MTREVIKLTLQASNCKIHIVSLRHWFEHKTGSLRFSSFVLTLSDFLLLTFVLVVLFDLGRQVVSDVAHIADGVLQHQGRLPFQIQKGQHGIIIQLLNDIRHREQSR